MEESAKEACEEKYDSLIVIISSHGIKGHILCTNMTPISFESIYKMYTVSYPELSKKPKIFIFDCCVATNQRIKNELNSINEEKEQQCDGIFDEQLIQIIAQSMSIQTKMNRMDGSYLLHEFGKRIVSNIGNSQCLGQMLDEINLCRYNLNKSQIQCIFYGNARYIKLLQNDDCDDKKVEKRKRLTISRRSNKRNQSSQLFADTSNSPKSSNSNHEQVHFLHIPVERGAHIANISVFGSDTTMSAGKRDRFIRRKKRIKKNNESSKKYEAIEMKEYNAEDDAYNVDTTDDTLQDMISQNVLAVTCSNTDTESDEKLSFVRTPKEGEKRSLSIHL